jgi:hypothetical protein
MTSHGMASRTRRTGARGKAWEACGPEPTDT